MLENQDLTENTISQKEIFKGRAVSLSVHEVSLPDGNVSSREVVGHSGGVGIIPLTDNNKIVMVKQYRKAVEAVCLEIPAGKLEPPESPLDCGMRELEEETGYKSDCFEYLTYIYPSPGYSSEKIYIYAAKNLYKGKTNLDRDEFLNVEIISIDKAVEMINRGEIKDAKTIVGILWLARKKYN